MVLRPMVLTAEGPTWCEAGAFVEEFTILSKSAVPSVPRRAELPHMATTTTLATSALATYALATSSLATSALATSTLATPSPTTPRQNPTRTTKRGSAIALLPRQSCPETSTTTTTLTTASSPPSPAPPSTKAATTTADQRRSITKPNISEGVGVDRTGAMVDLPV